ncbi:MAG: ABC transporter permease [Bacteroidetes bacterium]|nr:ABC transporter permease [Bacteroidota bacterium]
MLKNYLVVAVRNLLRNKTFTAINIAGLAAGLAVFVLIFEFVAAEWNTNRFHKNFDSLYRLGTIDKNGNHDSHLAPGYAPAIAQNVPGVQAVVRWVDGLGSGVISYNDTKSGELKSFREENITYVDGNFLEQFSFPLASGRPSLQEPKTMALSETMANKFFGTTNISGQTLTVSNQFGNTPYTITAVFKNPTTGSDLQPEILLSLNTLSSAANRNENDWADPATFENGFSNYYLVLKKEANATAVSKAITQLMHAAQPSSNGIISVLQPFSELHLAPRFSYTYQTFGSLKLVALLLGVALLILLIGWVNYINLSTVQAMKRAKETGVRKVLGASRSQLTFQYLAETFLLTLLSVGLSLILVQLLQNGFNRFTGKSLSLEVLNHGWFWAAAIAFVFIGSLLSGGYVAFVLSSFKPVTAIRGKGETKSKGISLRKGLVVFQFTISILFIIATMVLYRQLQYMKTTNLGVSLDQLLVIKGPTVSSEDQAEKNVAFKNALGQLAFVKKYSGSNNVPGGGYNFFADHITRLSPQKDDEKKSYAMLISDEKFFDTYDIKFVQGKAFTSDDAMHAWMNCKKVLVNEKAAAELGFSKTENIVGQKINWANTQYEIAGVVKDYHHLSLQRPIDPVIFLPSVSFVYFTIQTDVNNLQQKISSLNALYKQYFPGNPFEYFFADEKFNKQYVEEQQLGNVFIASAVIAVIIACMGLFGLAAFTAQQRTKEIGIRKVLGASVTNIATLLSKDFVKLVFIAICIASPVAWWALNKWLSNFAYRTNIGWWIFAGAGTMAILIAVLTVSFQAVKAAVASPVKSLRTE